MDPDHSGLNLLLIFFVKKPHNPTYNKPQRLEIHMSDQDQIFHKTPEFFKDKVLLFLTSYRIGHLVLQV